MPNNHPETNNSISPELEVALVLLEKARQDLIAVQWRYDLLPPTSYSDFDRKPAYDLAHRVWIWAGKLVKNETS